MKVWKVQETIVNSDEALELQLNTLERTGARIKEVILAHKYETPTVTPTVMYLYKIIYTEEDVMEVEDASTRSN